MEILLIVFQGKTETVGGRSSKDVLELLPLRLLCGQNLDVNNGRFLVLLHRHLMRGGLGVSCRAGWFLLVFQL